MSFSPGELVEAKTISGAPFFAIVTSTAVRAAVVQSGQYGSSIPNVICVVRLSTGTAFLRKPSDLTLIASHINVLTDGKAPDDDIPF